jgi:3-methyladenine DNA glycosylase AlkD
MATAGTPALDAAGWVAAVRGVLEPVADAGRAPAMQAYMKDVAPFLGVATPARRSAVRPLGRPPADLLPAVCRALWREPERELAYVAADWLVAAARRGPAEWLGLCEELVRARSWWDTVDTLAHAVGALVVAHPELVNEMDRWVADDDMWVARAAILHQLGRKGATDRERLFRLCLARADDPRFFLRKAIGWALRDLAWTDPTAVAAFVEANRKTFSALTIREATKNLAHSEERRARRASLG